MLTAEDVTKIYALYFDKNGCGPAPLSLALRNFPAVCERDEDHLGVQFKAEGLSIIASPAEGGLCMSREDVEQLHRKLGEWLNARASKSETSK